MTTFNIYKQKDQYEDYKLKETIEIEDTIEDKDNLINEYFNYGDGWEVEDDFEEFLNGEVDEIYFYRTSVPSHAWDKDIAGYIIKEELDN